MKHAWWICLLSDQSICAKGISKELKPDFFQRLRFRHNTKGADLGECYRGLTNFLYYFGDSL